MNLKAKAVLLAGLSLGGLGLAAGTASAMPMQGLDNAVAHSSDLQQKVDNVRYVCGYYGCHWVPGYWGWHRYHYWHHGYGWHHWHHWHHW